MLSELAKIIYIMYNVHIVIMDYYFLDLNKKHSCARAGGAFN